MINPKVKITCLNKPKILVRGDIWSYSGYSVAIRCYIECLLLKEYPVAIENRQHDKHSFKKEFPHIVSALSDFGRNECDIVLDVETPEFYNPVAGKFNIASVVWETSRIPEEWVPLINQMDMVMTASEFCKKVYIDSDIKIPIEVIPHAINYKEFNPGKGLNIGNIEKEDMVFLYCAQLNYRKNVDALMIAYVNAFKSQDPVALILKLYRNDFSLEEQQATKDYINETKEFFKIPHLPKIFLITENVSSVDLPDLYRTADVFVSPSFGEGYGLTSAEAMSTGCIPIINNYSAQKELISKDKWDGFLVDCVMEPVMYMGHIPWYKLNQQWARIKINDLTEIMKKVFELRQSDPNEFKRIGKRARATIINKFSPEVIASKLDAMMQKIWKNWSSREST